MDKKMNKSSSSSSDWDSMPEENPVKVKEGHKVTAAPSEEKTTTNTTTTPVANAKESVTSMTKVEGRPSKLPPFDFRSEIADREEKALNNSSRKESRPAGQDRPRRKGAYRPTAKKSSGKMVQESSSEEDESKSLEETWTPSKVGRDNVAFVTEEKADNHEEDKDKDHVNEKEKTRDERPVAEESLRIFVFDEPSNGYMASNEYGSSGVMGDRLLRLLSGPVTRVCSELLGILRLPLHLMLLIVGQMMMGVIDGLVRPLTEFMLKPLIVAMHNLLLLPLCMALHQLVTLSVHALQPCSQLCCCSSQGTRDREVKLV